MTLFALAFFGVTNLREPTGFISVLVFQWLLRRAAAMLFSEPPLNRGQVQVVGVSAVQRVQTDGETKCQTEIEPRL